MQDDDDNNNDDDNNDDDLATTIARLFLRNRRAKNDELHRTDKSFPWCHSVNDVKYTVRNRVTFLSVLCDKIFYNLTSIIHHQHDHHQQQQHTGTHYHQSPIYLYTPRFK